MKLPKAFFVLLVLPTTSANAEVVGKARVIDGSTLEVGGRTVRLHGIDAPTEAQSCTQDGKPWSCGREASFALAFQVGDHWLACEERGRDGEDRILAVCRVGGKDLGRLMVAQGWALADRRVGQDYGRRRKPGASGPQRNVARQPGGAEGFGLAVSREFGRGLAQRPCALHRRRGRSGRRRMSGLSGHRRRSLCPAR
jgi:endonuclease YncB( thermonuclease family)